MNSDEKKIAKNYLKEKESLEQDRLNIPMLKYFWQASPLATNRKKSIPKFLRNIDVFKHFSDYELKTFSNFLHNRTFASEEIIIEEGDAGFGFYLIFTGNIEVYSKRQKVTEAVTENYHQLITRLSKYEYFGELALLENQSARNATAVSKGTSSVLAIYRPDLEELIDRYPVVGAKLLQALSLIVSRRFNQVTEELKTLKDKCSSLESQIVDKNVQN